MYFSFVYTATVKFFGNDWITLDLMYTYLFILLKRIHLKLCNVVKLCSGGTCIAEKNSPLINTETETTGSKHANISQNLFTNSAAIVGADAVVIIIIGYV